MVTPQLRHEECLECGSDTTLECNMCTEPVCDYCMDDHVEWEHSDQESEL